MTAPIRIGQLGICHEHAAAKMRSLRILPELFEVVGVVDDRNSTATRRIDPDFSVYEGLPWLSEEELFARPGLEAVLVETANGDLVPAAQRCRERGLAMHMDKPGGEELMPFVQLREACEAAGLPFQMGYMFRGNPAMNRLREIVDAGWLGEIFAFQADMSHDYGGDEYQQYIGAFAGGIMFNLGCHLLDYLVALLGAPEEVTAFLSTVAGDASHNHCLSVLRYPGALARVHACSREVNAHGKRSMTVCGTRGTAELPHLERFNGEALTLHLDLKCAAGEYPAGRHVIDFGVQHDRYAAQLRDFAAMIRGERDTTYDAAHDCLVQRVLLAAAGYETWS